MTTNEYTTNLVSLQGSAWQVLKWDWNETGDRKEWTQVGPYYDTEAEAEQAIAALESADSRDKAARAKWGFPPRRLQP
jgi:hypothetical protein